MQSEIVKPFRLSFNNRKKRKPGVELQEFNVDAALFVATGHVALDIDAAKCPPLFTSMQTLRETLGWWGDVQVEGLEEEAV